MNDSNPSNLSLKLNREEKDTRMKSIDGRETSNLLSSLLIKNFHQFVLVIRLVSVYKNALSV